MRSSALVLLLSLSLPLQVHAENTLRVVLRIAREDDRALAPRIVGQLSDVDAQLITTETAPLEAAVAEQLEVARTLAALQGADAVVWCTREGQLYIELARSDRVLASALQPAPGGTLSSSDLETAAVLVRSALVALVQNVELGVPSHTLAADGGEPADDPPQLPAAPEAKVELPAPAALPVVPAVRAERMQVDRAEPPRVESATPIHAALQARLSLGAQLSLDGQSSTGQRGVSARVGVGLGAWALDAFGVLSLPGAIDDPYFALSVARHAAGLALERAVALSETLELGVALQGAALLWHRKSRGRTPDAVSSPPSLTAAFAFGPELALRWLPAHFGLSLRFGLDILPVAPRFQLAAATQSHSLWNLEPRMTLAWETTL